ncbi:MAG: hypothetical protein JSW58_17565 [Candidatus Latescibacterota bacterium]|nr:MAG: hypothetical protein JSW58_17565 [Candidatus Latescibacterota bacterium]
MKVRFHIIVWIVFATLVVPALAWTQTSVSVRMRSLGTPFSGLIDDYLTDVYLNPARVADLDGSMVYALRLPPETIIVPYPTVPRYSYYLTLDEVDIVQYGVEPVGLSYFGSVFGGSAISLGTEMYVSNDDRFTGDVELEDWGAGLRRREANRGDATEIHHYVLDITLGSSSDTGGRGVRLRADYDRFDFTEGERTDDLIYTGDTAPEIERRLRSRVNTREYERATLEIAGGVHRPGTLLREIIVGAGLARDRLVARYGWTGIDDEDVDGNGLDPQGGLASYVYEHKSYESDREYWVYDVFARMHLEWTEHVRTKHILGFTRSDGDGGAGFVTDDEWYGTAETFRRTDGSYSYDGMTQDIWAETAIGFSTRPVENVLIALAVQGLYRRMDFEEAGPGDASLTSNGGGTDESAYAQWHDRKDETFEVSLPVAMEWSFHKYAKLRIGIGLFVDRQEYDYLFTRGAAALEAFSEIPSFVPLARQDRDVETDTEITYSNGLEININERFVLDLQGGGTYSSVNLASFGFISARYRF